MCLWMWFRFGELGGISDPIIFDAFYLPFAFLLLFRCLLVYAILNLYDVHTFFWSPFCCHVFFFLATRLCDCCSQKKPNFSWQITIFCHEIVSLQYFFIEVFPFYPTFDPHRTKTIRRAMQLLNNHFNRMVWLWRSAHLGNSFHCLFYASLPQILFVCFLNFESIDTINTRESLKVVIDTSQRNEKCCVNKHSNIRIISAWLGLITWTLSR